VPEHNIERGLSYTKFKTLDTRVHVLRVGMAHNTIQPVPAGGNFPLSDYYGITTRPPQLARKAGALASVGGGFPFTQWHHQGEVGQPMGVMQLARELWTTGAGHGGHAYLQGKHKAYVQPARTSVAVWGGGEVVHIDSVNRGHVGTVAFTYRGGTSEQPDESRSLLVLRDPGAWEDADGRWIRHYTVGRATGLAMLLDVVLESDLPLPFELGQTVRWVQDMGAPSVLHAVSGMTELVRDGQNAIPLLDLFGDPSHGPDAWYARKNPRTALGVSEDGRTAYVVVVEGRVQGSKGFRLKQFANVLIELGAYNAVNLDGGGSSHMWVKGMGLVADSCYGDGTLEGVRPNIYSTAVFAQ